MLTEESIEAFQDLKRVERVASYGDTVLLDDLSSHLNSNFENNIIWEAPPDEQRSSSEKYFPAPASQGMYWTQALVASLSRAIA